MAHFDFQLDTEKSLQLDLRILVRVLLDEFNRLRNKAGMPQITLQDFVSQMKAKARQVGPIED